MPGASELERLQLVPGHHLVPSSEGWLLYPPDGHAFRLNVDGEVMKNVADVLDGKGTAGEIPTAARDVLERFVARGFAEVAAQSSQPALELRVCVVGSGPIAEALHTLLETTGLPEPSRAGAGELPAQSVTTDLVVTCAGWLPDAHWQRVHAWCREQEVAWHGCHAEGDHFYLGPYWSPNDPATPSYRDVRDRRLAADPHPDGLEAYWRYVDRGEGVPPVPWPDAGRVAVIAGALASDLLAVARGERPPSHGHQLALDPATGTWRRHPVLPVPRGLMTECLP
ncbi:MAG: hypothetical protein MPN21_00965 [Thermoanaerobaculia bacterium]|nr:hypothetical protein [Thermoanaerobaculia bacterium]